MGAGRYDEAGCLPEHDQHNQMLYSGGPRVYTLLSAPL